MAQNVIEVRLSGGGAGGGGGPGSPPGGGPADNPGRDRFLAIVEQIDAISADLSKGVKTASEAFREIDAIAKKNRDFLNQSLREIGVHQSRDDEAQNTFAQRAAARFNAENPGGIPVVAPRIDTLGEKNAATAAKAAAKEKAEAEKADREAADQAERDHLAKLRTTAQLASQVAGGSGLGKVSGAAGLAQMAGLGGSTAAMLAGPEFAAAVALKEAAEELIRMPFQAARAGLEGIGKVSQQVASGDGRGAFESAVEGVAGGLESTGLAGTYLAEQLRTAAKAATVFTDTVNAVAERGKALAQFNSGIGGAVAEQNVAQVRRDIDEAKRLGPDYQRTIRAQTQFQEAGDDVLVFLKGQLMGALLEIAEPVADFLRETKQIRKAVFGVAGLVNPLKAYIGMLPPVLLLKFVNLLLKWFGGDEDKKDAGLIDQLRDAARGIEIGAGKIPEPPAQQRGPVARPPLFPDL